MTIKNSPDKPGQPAHLILPEFGQIERYEQTETTENRELERKRVTIDTPVVLSAKKQPEFVGWFADPGLTQAIDTVDMYDDSKTFYPKWSARWYEISYVLEEGINSELNHHCYTENSGLLPLYPALSPGRQFLGWHLDGKKVECIDPRWTRNVRLVALFQDPVTAVFEDGRGEEIAKVTCDENGHVDPGLCPCRPGYRFAGWSLDPDGLRSWNCSRPITENRTIYAKWTPEHYTITLYPAGGKLAGSAEIEYTMETPAFILPAPERAGYRFAGWYDHRDRIWLIIRKGSRKTMRLSARWVPMWQDQYVIGDEPESPSGSDGLSAPAKGKDREQQGVMAHAGSWSVRCMQLSGPDGRKGAAAMLPMIVGTDQFVKDRPHPHFVGHRLVEACGELDSVAAMNLRSGLHADHGLEPKGFKPLPEERTLHL